MSPPQPHDDDATLTSMSLKKAMRSDNMRKLSPLSLPEIDDIADSISRMVPAGNLPGIILSGLAQVSQRRVPKQDVRRDVNLLFKGVESRLDQAVYTTFFATPAAILWAYQNLLRMLGRDLEDAFPEGTWQFYVDYALREDTARHTNETHGFDTILRKQDIQLSPVDRITAWVMACIYTLEQYDELLANEWRERVYTSLLRELTVNERSAQYYAALYRQWEHRRPYHRGPDVQPEETYAQYRERKFREFLDHATDNLAEARRAEWQAAIDEKEATDLQDYIDQMSICAYLKPDPYGEVRVGLPLGDLNVGVIYKGHYYLMPAFLPGTETPSDVHSVRNLIAKIVMTPSDDPPAQLISLAKVRRAAHPDLRGQFSEQLAEELERLQYAPILLNMDKRFAAVPLAELRQGERGIGDHGLTVFTTGETFAFDQSHIFFDGAWGAALAEIMTNEALSWAVYLNSLPPAQPATALPYSPLLKFTTNDRKLVSAAPTISTEASAESESVNLEEMMLVRKLFKMRSDELNLTVNDLLLLYRAIHAVTYKPHPVLISRLEELAAKRDGKEAALTALDALQNSQTTNPAILIPMDASRRNPRDRVHPMSFEVPLSELDLINLHKQVTDALNAYLNAESGRREAYQHFDKLQRSYLATLASFGIVLKQIKEIAANFESSSVSAIKLLAHLPRPLQRLLDQIPQQFDVLNDVIKGREVFSNVGAVAGDSTLTRFMTAKDDNDKKSLAWGVLTDANKTMTITLRDFRPHVALLHEIGRHDLATWICQDYLDTYTLGINQFIRELHRITQASRETNPTNPETFYGE